MNTLSTRRTASPSLVSNANTSPVNPKALSNQQIEAVIQMATSSASAAARDTRTQLFVGNLPYRVRWQDLKDLFRKAGTVLRADVSLGPDNRSRGYGTVLLATGEDAARAVDMFNGYNWQTRTLEVRPDRIPPDFDHSSPLPVSTHQSPVPHMVAGPFPVPVRPTYGSPVADRAPSFTSSDELDPSKNFSERMSSSTARSLFVGNLPFHCQWQELKDLFRQAGSILRADVALGPDGRSRGFGTVSFTNDIDAEQAVNMFNGYEYNGRVLKVHYDKYSGLPQSPLPSSALATPSPTQLQHAPPMHIPMPLPPPVSTFEHLAAGHHPPSPFDHPFGQLSPYDVYPTHMSTYMTNAIPIPSSVCGSWVNPQQGQPTASSFVTTQAPVSSSPEARREGDTIQHHPLGVAATVTANASGTADPSVSSAPTDNTSNVGTASTATATAQAETQPVQSTQQHHPHPGPISLPSPPLHGFPIGGPISPLQGLPPLTPSMPSFTFVPQNATPPLNAHFLSPGVGITPFSPPMSPGSFYHPPPNQRYHVWNVAPGAPLHIPSPMGSPNIYQGYSNPVDSNKMDYFSVPPPPARVAEGYFPPVPVPSRLSKELLQEESPPEESGQGEGRNASDATVSGTSSSEDGPLGSLATKIGEQVLGNGLEEGLAELFIEKGGPAAPQRTHSDGSQKEDGEADVSVKDDDAWVGGAIPAERRASWTPASELARADFKKGL